VTVPDPHAAYAAHVAACAATTARALLETGFDRLLIHSGVPFTYFADDNDAPFHTTPHFAHWAPVDGPHHLLDVVPGKRPRLVRVQPRDFWYAPPAPAPDFVRREFDVVEVATPGAAWKEIGAAGPRTAFIGAATEETGAHGIVPAGVNPDAHFENLAGPTFEDFYPRFAKMLDSTRTQRLERNRREWLARSGRKRMPRAEKEAAASRLHPTTVFDYLWRLRIRSNYGDVSAFLMSGVDDRSHAAFHRGLVTLASGTCLLLQSLIVAYVGPGPYETALNEFTAGGGIARALRCTVALDPKLVESMSQ